MKTRNLFGFAVLGIVALTITTVGCSSDTILNPNDSTEGMQTLVKEEPRDAQSAQFSLSGTVLAFETEKYLMVFSAHTESDRSGTPTKYEMVVDKNAVVVLADRSEVAFDASYIQVGYSLIVSGRFDSDGTMVVERIDLRPVESNDVVFSTND